MSTLPVLVGGLFLLVLLRSAFTHLEGPFYREYRPYLPPQYIVEAPRRSLFDDLLMTAIFTLLVWIAVVQYGTPDGRKEGENNGRAQHNSLHVKP